MDAKLGLPIKKNEKDRLETMEMWIWRRMIKTLWVERKTNKQVLNDARKNARVLKNIYILNLLWYS